MPRDSFGTMRPFVRNAATSVLSITILASAVAAEVRAGVPASGPAGAPQSRPFDPADHVIPAPISRRANLVLANLVHDCPIINGTWDRRNGDPGCVELYSTMFGYRAGIRRVRPDLIAIGRVSADTEFSKLAGLAGSMLMGRSGIGMSDLVGAPALAASGMYGQNQLHYGLFITAMEFVSRMDSGGFDDVQNVGVAYLLAEASRRDPRPKPAWLEQARVFARRLKPAQRAGASLANFAAFAWASIARASGVPADLERARTLALSALPQFVRTEKGLRFDGPYSDCLSVHLVLADACADLAIIDPDPRWQPMAAQIVEYVFSDAYFNGKVLAHDIEDGKQAPFFCTGCNYHALYLADRLHGDTLKLDPVPPLRIVRGPLRIINARYGVEGQWTDVTSIIAKKVTGEWLKLLVNNDLGGAPVPGRIKELQVEYEIVNERRSTTALESEWLMIPR